MAAKGLEVTDDVSIVEHLGEPVRITKGSYENLKVRMQAAFLPNNAYKNRSRLLSIIKHIIQQQIATQMCAQCLASISIGANALFSSLYALLMKFYEYVEFLANSAMCTLPLSCAINKGVEGIMFEQAHGLHIADVYANVSHSSILMVITVTSGLNNSMHFQDLCEYQGLNVNYGYASVKYESRFLDSYIPWMEHIVRHVSDRATEYSWLGVSLILVCPC